jgi:hypothetical protein
VVLRDFRLSLLCLRFGVEAILPEGPPNVVGSRYTEVRKFMGEEMKSTMEITAFEQNV